MGWGQWGSVLQHNLTVGLREKPGMWLMLGPGSGLLTWVGGAIPLFGAAKPVTPLREAASQREEALLAGGAGLNTPALLAEGWPKVAAALWEEPEVALPGEEPALLEEAPEERPATPDHTADNTAAGIDEKHFCKKAVEGNMTGLTLGDGAVVVLADSGDLGVTDDSCGLVMLLVWVGRLVATRDLEWRPAPAPGPPALYLRESSSLTAGPTNEGRACALASLKAALARPGSRILARDELDSNLKKDSKKKVEHESEIEELGGEQDTHRSSIDDQNKAFYELKEEGAAEAPRRQAEKVEELRAVQDEQTKEITIKKAEVMKDLERVQLVVIDAQQVVKSRAEEPPPAAHYSWPCTWPKAARGREDHHASRDSIPVGCEAAHLDLSHDSGLGTLASRAAGGREGSQPTAQRVESLQVTVTRLAQAISSRPAPDGERPYSFSSSASGLVSSLLDLPPAPPPSKAEPTAFLSYVLHSLHSYQPDREDKAPGGEKDSQCGGAARHAGSGAHGLRKDGPPACLSKAVIRSWCCDNCSL